MLPAISVAVGGDPADGLFIIAVETAGGLTVASLTPAQADQLVASLIEWSARSPLNLQGQTTGPGEMRVQPIDVQEVGIADGGQQGDVKMVQLAFPVGLLTLSVRIAWNKLARVLNAYSQGQQQSMGKGKAN